MERTPAFFHDQYEIVRELGRGATATVYEARDRRLNRQVALRTLDLSYEAERPTKVRRFIRECRVLARLIPDQS